MMLKTIGLYKHRCRVCGKEFECRSSYAYKRGRNDNYIWFCSWHCIREYDKRIEKKKAKAFAINY